MKNLHPRDFKCHKARTYLSDVGSTFYLAWYALPAGPFSVPIEVVLDSYLPDSTKYPRSMDWWENVNRKFVFL
jgi:hypothetical protein